MQLLLGKLREYHGLYPNIRLCISNHFFYRSVSAFLQFHLCGFHRIYDVSCRRNHGHAYMTHGDNLQQPLYKKFSNHLFSQKSLTNSMSLSPAQKSSILKICRTDNFHNLPGNGMREPYIFRVQHKTLALSACSVK
jgi:hypothetical protein